MKLSVAWLRELVDLPDDVERLCDDLTLLGLEVEELEDVGVGYPGIVVGHVLEAGPHPNADRLSLCRVTDGTQEYPVVCGAPNVRTGLKVAFAAPGAVLPDGMTIKKTKIRGETSLGMICSERELDLGEGHTGILELDEGDTVGRALAELYGFADQCIEIEVTPNRPDWLSHIGVARELAARYGTELRVPDAGDDVEIVERADGWSCRVEDEVGCPRYTGRIVRGVTVGASPLWMRRRLMAIGQRPINAVVDCSNYVLHECGQPNHAFDLAKLDGDTIILRKARAKESCETLDGQTRELSPHHLVVADAANAIALAGVMGGGPSQVTGETRELLLEVAYFDPQTVRRMRRDLLLNTDASYRFERGVDCDAVPWTSRRLGKLITECSGGVASPIAFQGTGASPPEPARFFVRQSQVKRLLGVEIDAPRISSILTSLEIPAEIAEEDGEPGVAVVQPSFRQDLLEEVDGIEEVARHYGYDNIPVEDRAPMIRPAQREAGEVERVRLRQALAAQGFHEVVGSSFMQSEDPDRLELGDADLRRQSVEVLNPIVVGEAKLKTSSVPEMLRTVDRNRRRGYAGPIRLFQMDRSFVAEEGQDLPHEPEHLLLIWSGLAEPAHASRQGRPVDLFDALGDLDAALRALGIDSRVATAEPESYELPGGSVAILADQRELGRLGVIRPSVAKGFGVDDEVICAELSLGAVLEAGPGQRRYGAISVYPPVRRDLSLVAGPGVRYEQIAATLVEVCGDLLESHDVFDLYEGEGLGQGNRAIGVRLVLRSAKATLKDKRVDALLAQVVEKLEEELSVSLRSG